MIAFNFEGKKIEVATKWEEVTVGHYINPHFLSGNAIQLLAALAEIDPLLLANAKKDYSKHFSKVVNFINKDPLGWKRGGTEQLTVMGKTCLIPKDLESQTFGQKIMFGQILSKTTFHYAVIPEAVAIYIAPQLYPKNWYEKIDEIAAEIKDLPIRDVNNIADFFLSNTLQYRRGGLKN